MWYNRGKQWNKLRNECKLSSSIVMSSLTHVQCCDKNVINLTYFPRGLICYETYIYHKHDQYISLWFDLRHGFVLNLGMSSVSLVCTRDTNIVITVSADALAPNGAKPSAATLPIISRLYMFTTTFLWLKVIPVVFSTVNEAQYGRIHREVSQLFGFQMM